MARAQGRLTPSEVPPVPRALFLSLLLSTTAAPALAETTLRVMSFNIWGGGGNAGKPIDETLAAIRAAAPDIIGLQETRLEGATCDADYCPPEGPSVATALAAALGFHHDEQTAVNEALWANAVLSRHPIEGASGNGLGVEIDVKGRSVWIFNIHLDDEPCQPRQLLGIEYGPAPVITTEAEAIDYARQTRGPALDLLMADMAAAEEAAAEGAAAEGAAAEGAAAEGAAAEGAAAEGAAAEGAAAEGAAAVFVTGDFNEPSHLDWTPAAVVAGLHPVAVTWPTTARLAEAGFIDAYRAVHPDPVAKPAFTWTPTGDEADPDGHHGRIDLVLVRGAGVTVTEAAIVGEDGPRSDIKMSPWPSDHRAVMAEVRF
ncbi:MAG: endonuclease/exonuclease/phosphatase family protein [Gemmobacter sp.]